MGVAFVYAHCAKKIATAWAMTARDFIVVKRCTYSSLIPTIITLQDYLII